MPGLAPGHDCGAGRFQHRKAHPAAIHDGARRRCRQWSAGDDRVSDALRAVRHLEDRRDRTAVEVVVRAASAGQPRRPPRYGRLVPSTTPPAHHADGGSPREARGWALGGLPRGLEPGWCLCGAAASASTIAATAAAPSAPAPAKRSVAHAGGRSPRTLLHQLLDRATQRRPEPARPPMRDARGVSCAS